MSQRVPIPEDIAAEVLFRHAHTCCVCNERGKYVQIHHIDDDPSNNVEANLAVLCMQDHGDTQVIGGFGRKLGPREVIKYRDDWIRRVEERRRAADELAVQNVQGKEESIRSSTTEWTPPSDIALYTLVQNIPGIMKTAYDLAKPEWNKGATNTVTQATYQVIDVVEQLWNQISAWYPPNHFGKPSAQYFSEFLASRFQFRRALLEPNGPGTAGTMIRPMVAYGALLDAQQALVLTVRLLLLFSEQEVGFDINECNRRFDSATDDYNQ
jgi:hypothetical protein